MENDSKIEIFDTAGKASDSNQELAILEANMQIAEKEADTYGKFAKLLDTKMHGGIMGKTGVPLDSEQNRENLIDFASSPSYGKYILGLIVFLVVFFFILLLFVQSGTSMKIF